MAEATNRQKVVLTFPFFSEDSGLSDFFRPINVLIHFPETPIVSFTISQPSTNLAEEFLESQCKVLIILHMIN